MNYRTLGKIGLSVSEIGFGGIPIQRVSLDEAVKIIKKAGDLGVNFIDTGVVYTDSEEKIGQAIKNVRQDWIIASKSPGITYQEMKTDIEKSLKNLQTSYIDLYQIHHLKNVAILTTAVGESGALKAMKEAQKEGKIKFIGVTGHNLETLLLAAKTGHFNTVMANFNYKEQEAAQTLFPYCQKEGIGVIVMKPLAGGTFQNAASAIRFCLSIPGVSTVIPGVSNERELQEDLVEVSENPQFALEDEKKLKEEVSAIGLPFCRACGYCITQDNGCPARINISLFLRLEGYFRSANAVETSTDERQENELARRGYTTRSEAEGGVVHFQKYGALAWILEAYRKNPVPPSSCTLCGHCERVCPFHLPIIRALRDLRVRKEVEKRWGEEKAVVGAPLREYQKEYQKFVNLTQEKLGPDHQIPLAYFNYPKPANEGQKVTVRGLWQRLEEKMGTDKEKKQEILKTLAADMGISENGVGSFENLLTLADYDNIVDLMRALPPLIKNP